MGNKSLAQVEKEIARARTYAISDPHRFERAETVSDIDGNTLSDLVSNRDHEGSVGKQSVSTLLLAKIESLFVKFPKQYKVLGLYYNAGFTTQEIADMLDISRSSVAQTRISALKRLKKYLSEQEYDQIRWILKDPKLIEASPREVCSGYVNCRSRYVDMIQSIPVSGYEFKHPDKHLPKPRHELE